MEITITRDEAIAFVDLIENYLLDTIRANIDIDGVEWLSNLLTLYTKIKKVEVKCAVNR